MPTLKAKSPLKPVKAKKLGQEKPALTEKSGQETWDELLQTPESEVFLTMLVAEARAERQSGKLIEGDWE
ncbi:MAG: hypothetical protein MUF71_05830 [Candidatus Kapabacteria bacterium]|jgi:hypothetical protein|nr:hypothetical protein [Candidatus Kapabacteria bacterium]